MRIGFSLNELSLFDILIFITFLYNIIYFHKLSLSDLRVYVSTICSFIYTGLRVGFFIAYRDNMKW